MNPDGSFSFTDTPRIGGVVEYLRLVSNTTFNAAYLGDYQQVQEYVLGAWHPVAATSCYPLDRTSSAAVVVNSQRSWAGHLFRLDAVFEGDHTYATTYGAWQYFITSG